MTETLALSAAFLLLASCPRARAEPDPEPARLDELRDQLTRQMQEMQPVSVRLEEEIRDLNDRHDLAKVFAQRDPLLLDAKVKLEKLSRLEEQFNLLKKEHENANLLSDWQQILGGKIPRDAGSKFNAAMDQAHFAAQVYKFRTDLLVLMGTEQMAFRAAMDYAAARQRAQRVVLGGAGLLALAGFALWRRPGPRLVRAPPKPAPEPASDLGADTEGRVLASRYRLEGELGRGDMGMVCSALDLGRQRKVVIRRMYLEGREVFLKEARLLVDLKHPNIVETFDLFEERGRVYLAMEYAQGKTLRELVASQGRMGLAQAKRIFAQVCRALDYAHAKGLIHRDLKPSNIMVCADGAVKVMDFGVSRRLKTSYREAVGMGTPTYVAPEVELGSASRESDLYALGVCLYEAVTGSLPFLGPDFLGQKQRMEFTVPTRLAGDLPAGIDAVIARALQAEPARRFGSGSEFSSSLEVL